MKRWLFLAGAIAAVAIAERRWPLRRRRESDARHVARDVAMAVMSVAATSAAQSIVLRRELQRVAGRRVFLPRTIVAFLALDYMLWIWHHMNHVIPHLWRFHRVHHVDLDLDAATGARFHFGEMTLSVLFRWIQLRLLRPDRIALSAWQTALLASIFFHHSNLRLPERAERMIAFVLVTPRMHGIHHSTVHGETNSNFASLLTWWDLLHGRFRFDVPQERITIGVPAYQQIEDVTLPKIVALPLRDTSRDWLLDQAQEL